jgi:hypothetical protein
MNVGQTFLSGPRILKTAVVAGTAVTVVDAPAKRKDEFT